MSDMPADLEGFLPSAASAAWPKLVPLVPDDGYLAGGTALTVHAGGSRGSEKRSTRVCKG
jgi:hypothetical protein